MSIFRFLKSIQNGEPIEVYGDGTQKRDFTYVDDIADGTIKALKKCGYEIVNLGNSSTVELRYVIKLIEKAIGRRAQVKFLPRHPADVLVTHASVKKARELFGWKPRVGIEEGIKHAVEWFLEYGERKETEVRSQKSEVRSQRSEVSGRSTILG